MPPPRASRTVARLIERIEDPTPALPCRQAASKSVLRVLVATLHSLNEQIGVLDTEIARRAKVDPLARRLMTIPGVGPVIATAIVALAPDPRTFKAGYTALRRLGGAHAQTEVDRRASRRAGGHLPDGQERNPATAADYRGQRRGQAGALCAAAPAGSWLAQMLARKPRMLVTVALANKTARIVWALMARGGVYRAPVAAA